MRTLLVVAAIALGGVSTARADGFVPPMTIDVGWAAAPTASGRETLIGLSWATVNPFATWFEVELGYVRVDADTRAVAARGATMDDEAVRLHGAYAELGARVASGRGWRGWASARLEAGRGNGDGFLGGAARLGAELWTGLRGGCDGGPGGIVGALALGAWVEIGARDHADVRGTFVAAGLGIRVPFIGYPGTGRGCCR